MKILYFLCLAATVFGFKIKTPSENSPSQLKSKIPEFIGLGYHLLLGNPFTNHIDEGFRAPIFTFTYDKNQRTQDDKYQIPDYTHSSETISCSLETKVSEYTGTQNYQKQLQKIIKIDSKLSSSFTDAAFSFSRTFSQFSNSTQNHKQTSYQSNAECTVYTLQMPLYSNQIQLTLDFVEGVKTCYAEQGWDEFIEHFGTHYASSVIYGGRYLFQHTYSQQSMSLFTSMKLDIQLAAKVQYFNKIGVNITEEVKKYQNQTNFVNTKVEVQRLSTLGGLPPRSGNWLDWADTVKDNLAPISYHLTTISTLFNFIKGLDVTGAIKSYNTFLNTYCQKNRCPSLSPDRPAPKPLQISYAKLQQISGASKNPRTYDTNDGNVKVGMRVNKVLMGSQGSIDSIQFFLTDGIIEHALPVVGNRGFNHQYEVPKADQINCIRFGITYNKPYWKFTSMQFVTKNGVQSQVFSGSSNINQYRILCLQNNPEEHFIGFYGNYGDTFDSIGFNVMKQTIEK